MNLTIAAAKRNFFDSAKVKRAVDRGKRQALSKCGAFVRTAARSSLRYRKKPSASGQPPSVHKGRGGKSPLKLIFFAWDASSKTVVVGAVLFAPATGAPRTLEHGGSVGRRKNPRRRVRTLAASGEIRLQGKKAVYAKLTTARQVAAANRLQAQLYGPEFFAGGNAAARPFMQPALKKEAPKFPLAFRGSVK